MLATSEDIILLYTVCDGKIQFLAKPNSRHIEYLAYIHRSTFKHSLPINRNQGCDVGLFFRTHWEGWNLLRDFKVGFKSL